MMTLNLYTTIMKYNITPPHPPLKLLFRLTLSKNELGNFREFSFELL